MLIPSFSAEASLYRSDRHYATVFPRARVANPEIVPSVGEPKCSPRCFGPCRPDENSPTGCSQTCQTVQCEPLDRPCTPCPGGCHNCSPSQGCCSGVCTSFGSDPRNCGWCGHTCPPGQSCCNSACSDLRSDPQNCGSCGNACPAGQPCSNGSCCPSGQTDCNGKCVDLSNDPWNCGGCGQVCNPLLGKQCLGGRCLDPCAACTNCHKTDIGWCFCNGKNCGWGSSCCVPQLPPPPKPGCWFNGTACYGAVQMCHYCCASPPAPPGSPAEYSEQCGQCVGFWQAPPCYPTGPGTPGF